MVFGLLTSTIQDIVVRAVSVFKPNIVGKPPPESATNGSSSHSLATDDVSSDRTSRRCSAETKSQEERFLHKSHSHCIREGNWPPEKNDAIATGVYGKIEAAQSSTAIVHYDRTSDSLFISCQRR